MKDSQVDKFIQEAAPSTNNIESPQVQKALSEIKGNIMKNTEATGGATNPPNAMPAAASKPAEVNQARSKFLLAIAATFILVVAGFSIAMTNRDTGDTQFANNNTTAPEVQDGNNANNGPVTTLADDTLDSPTTAPIGYEPPGLQRPIVTYFSDTETTIIYPDGAVDFFTRADFMAWRDNFGEALLADGEAAYVEAAAPCNEVKHNTDNLEGLCKTNLEMLSSVERITEYLSAGEGWGSAGETLTYETDGVEYMNELTTRQVTEAEATAWVVREDTYIVTLYSYSEDPETIAASDYEARTQMEWVFYPIEGEYKLAGFNIQYGDEIVFD